MARFIVRRGLSAIALLFAVSVVVFGIFEVIPSYNPARAIAGRNANQTTVNEVARKFGFDKPVYDQYANTMKLIFTGQVIDYQDDLNVVDQFRQKFPVTLSLVIPAALLWLLASIVFGSFSAVRVGRLADRAVMVAAIVGVSIPVFLLAELLLYLFAFKWSVFPNTGYTTFATDPAQWALHLILPWISIAVLSVGFYSRVLRSNLLDMVNQDFVRTARAKGLPRRRVFVRHVLRNSMMPILTMFGLDFATLLGGAALVTETVFNLPGVGQYEAQAIGQLDVPPILVGAMFTAFFVVLFGAAADVMYALLDPRIPAQRLMAERLLDVEDLQVSFATEDGIVRAVDSVSFTLDRGEVLAIVGESGSGKSVTVMTLMGLTRSPNSRFAGSARLRGTDLVGASEHQLEAIRGKEIAMIFQDPISSLSPVHRIGDQIIEQIRAHEKISKAAALDRAVDLMERVGIPRARDRARAFPHEFSGGMRQRAMIAMALSLSPGVLIADEPTTALDVTIQAQILQEVRQLSAESDSGVIFVTHDLGVVADIADRVLVMYAGRVVEQGTLDEIFYDPQHPYTWGLLGSMTRMDREPPRRLPAIPGQPPSLVNAPTGCHFRPRCPHEFEHCVEIPPLAAHVPEAPAHVDRCWLEVADKRAKREVEGRIGLGTGSVAG